MTNLNISERAFIIFKYFYYHNENICKAFFYYTILCASSKCGYKLPQAKENISFFFHLVIILQ